MDTSRFGTQHLNNEIERSPLKSISSSITPSEDENEVDSSNSSDSFESGIHGERQSLSPRSTNFACHSKKEINYNQFKKRGNNNIPLRNIK